MQYHQKDSIVIFVRDVTQQVEKQKLHQLVRDETDRANQI